MQNDGIEGQVTVRREFHWQESQDGELREECQVLEKRLNLEVEGYFAHREVKQIV